MWIHPLVFSFLFNFYVLAHFLLKFYLNIAECRFSGFQANARCHKPVDPNLWWLAAQARIYRYVSAWQMQRLIET